LLPARQFCQGFDALVTFQDFNQYIRASRRISYTRGHVTFEVDRSGRTTSYSLAGGSRQTDVCAVLAS
jgi:hypothetical protein